MWHLYRTHCKLQTGGERSSQKKWKENHRWKIHWNESRLTWKFNVILPKLQQEFSSLFFLIFFFIILLFLHSHTHTHTHMKRKWKRQIMFWNNWALWFQKLWLQQQSSLCGINWRQEIDQTLERWPEKQIQANVPPLSFDCLQGSTSYNKPLSGWCGNMVETVG